MKAQVVQWDRSGACSNGGVEMVEICLAGHSHLLLMDNWREQWGNHLGEEYCRELHTYNCVVVPCDCSHVNWEKFLDIELQEDHAKLVLQFSTTGAKQKGSFGPDDIPGMAPGCYIYQFQEFQELHPEYELPSDRPTFRWKE